MDLLFVTGLSGAGKSTCLDALEDLGHYCVDNLPVSLVPDLVAAARKADDRRSVAVGTDAREADYLAEFPAVADGLRAAGHVLSLIFLDASREVLIRRYSETRRKHPMGELPDAIERERELLGSLRELADVVLDTSTWTGRQLRQIIRDRYARGSAALRVVLVSFGYRSGLPTEADVVLDSRFLKNPWDHADLRPLTGLHEPVARFVLEQDEAGEFLDLAERLVAFLVPRTLKEGRSYLTVAIGCTGGQHRSVALVERLARALRENPRIRETASLVVRHREIGRD